MPSSGSPAIRASSATRNRPYSLSLSPIFTARVRMATLWSLLPVKYCRSVDAFLGLTGDPGLVGHAEQAVLAQLEPHLHRPGANGHVVVLAAGEVLHGGAEALRQQGANVHLQAFAAHLGAGFILAAGEYFLHPRIGDELVERVLGGGAGQQQIQVAHRLAPAAQAARRGHGLRSEEDTSE